ncbi:MAG: hypothetical protein A3J24_06460 [Deltaproteobacteria bacterium RIFCSPLOWO2_02_FULL_53_8]|nr:MAG: hypothetical protein A3J24_06460 [Deltaproteobacteria bacterium RIFCSPLOWO2_02_FULL_53_8]
MATTPFTTWEDLRKAMLDALADCVATGGFKATEFTFEGRSIHYRTLDELRKGIEWASTMAATEGGTTVGRTYAKNGGGGRW